MKTWMSYGSALSAALVMSLPAAHAQSANKKIIDVSAAFQIGRTNVSPTEADRKRSAELLIDAAEQMMTPAGLLYASDLVNVALMEDPGNRKAQFYRRVLSITDVLEGYHRRLTPIVNRVGTAESKLNHQRVMNELPTKGGATDVLVGGDKPAFESEADIQVAIDETIGELEKLRQFIKGNKDLKMQISWFNDLTDTNEVSFTQSLKGCNVIRLDAFRYEMDTNCRHYKPMRLKLDRGDLEALQSIVAGMEVSLIMTSAYKGDGYLEVLRQANLREARGQKGLTDKDITSILKRNQRFGALRSTQRLGVIPSLGADLLAGARFFKANEARFCHVVKERDQWGRDQSYPKNDSTHLFKNGICQYPNRDAEFAALTNRIEGILRGQIVTEHVSRTEWKYNEKTNSHDEVVIAETKARVNYLAPFVTPELNLQNILPDTFNKCGSIKALKDKSFIAGALIDRDGDKVLRIQGLLKSDDEKCN